MRKFFESQGNLFVDIDRYDDVEFNFMSDGRLYISANNKQAYDAQHTFIELKPDEVDALRRLLNNTKGM